MEYMELNRIQLLPRSIHTVNNTVYNHKIIGSIFKCVQFSASHYQIWGRVIPVGASTHKEVVAQTVDEWTRNWEHSKCRWAFRVNLFSNRDCEHKWRRTAFYISKLYRPSFRINETKKNCTSWSFTHTTCFGDQEMVLSLSGRFSGIS